jgi:hypothetical protein
MKAREHNRNRRRWVLVCVSAALGVVGLVAGCLPPPRMELSQATRRRPDKGVWWYVTPEARPRSPVVAVEQVLSESRVRQWLLDNRGIRVFEYRGGRLQSWGPPVSSVASTASYRTVRSLVQARFGCENEPGWPGPPLPSDAVSGTRDSADLVSLLRRHWADAQVDPPAGLSAHDVSEAMVAAKVTVSNLLQLAE